MNIGILGAGGIARVMAQTINKMDQARLYAIGSRNVEKAQAFAQEFKIEKAYGSYEELVKERREDHYFADSWEQSIQISKDIEKNQDNIIFLQHVFQKLFFETKLTISEWTRLKTLCI